MLDNRPWRLIAFTKDELCEISGIFEYLESNAIQTQKWSGDDLLKGKVLMYVPLNGHKSWRDIEVDGSLLDGYFMICMGHRILARVCDGSAIEYRPGGAYKERDKKQLVFKINIKDKEVDVQMDVADVSGPNENGINEYYGVNVTWDDVVLEGDKYEQAETLARLNEVWEEQRAKLTILPIEPIKYS